MLNGDVLNFLLSASHLPLTPGPFPSVARPPCPAEECLLNHNRNPQLSRQEIEGWLQRMLGVQVRAAAIPCYHLPELNS